MVSIKVHGILDYVLGAVLIASPYVFGFSAIDAGRNLFLVLGIALIVYSLLTNYPVSLLKLIPVNVHMALDVLAGIALILGSYLFSYNAFLTMGQSALHYILGIGTIVLVAITQPKSGRTGKISDEHTPAEPIDINRRSA